MNLIQKSSIAVVIAPLLLCINAFAMGPPVVDVNVVNSPDVNVVNTPDVNVVNTPDVNVVNTPVRIPWSATISTTAQDGDKGDSLTFLSFPDDFPENHMVVVEAFSYNVKVPNGQSVRVVFFVQGSDDNRPMSLHMPQVGGYPISSTHTEFVDNASFRAYSRNEPPTSGLAVQAIMRRNSDVGQVPWTVSASGYFLPLDSPTLAP